MPEINPWRRRPFITNPPDSVPAWFKLAVWEFSSGVLVCSALMFGTRLIVRAPDNLVTVFDLRNCYAAPPVAQPCERVAYRAGVLNVVLNAWCGLLLVAAAAWLLWVLWEAVAPKPITDEFLKLLDDSFGRNWRRPSTWPWVRMRWAYGFTFVGALVALFLGTIVSTAVSSHTHAPTVHVETFAQFRATR